jgi:ubiquinone/menaquinone biosynthesis C-methylase UbiE
LCFNFILDIKKSVFYMCFTEPSSLKVFATVLGGYVGSRSYQRYVESLGLTGGEWVLDYGSGSGRITRHIAERLAPESGHLTCVDISTVWMDVVKKRLKGYPNADFKLGDIAALDIPDDAYDVVVVHFVLHHVDADVRQKNVSILSQKLKKGGRLFIRDPVREEHGTPAHEIRQLMANAGLHEGAFQMEKSFHLGPRYSGVFVKD